MEPQNAISAGALLYTSSTKKRPLLLTIESDSEAEEPPMKKIKLEKEPEVKVEKEPEVKEDAILSLGFDALVRPDEELDKKESEIKRQRELVQQRKQQLRERIDAFFGTPARNDVNTLLINYMLDTISYRFIKVVWRN
jgi:hypothetical protein